MKSHILLSLCLAVLAATPLTGQAQAAQPGNVTITATDYGFKSPEQVPSGLTAIEVINEGAEVHHAQLVRLAPGKTPADFAAAMKADPSIRRSGPLSVARMPWFRGSRDCRDGPATGATSGALSCPEQGRRGACGDGHGQAVHGDGDHRDPHR